MTEQIELTSEKKDMRIKALEGLLHYYLTEDRHGATKEFVTAVGVENVARINFAMPPTKGEIKVLISHLNLLIKNTPETRLRVTLAVINEVFEGAGLPKIESRKS